MKSPNEPKPFFFQSSVLVLGVFLMLFFANSLCSQVNQEWAKRYNSTGSTNDYAYDICSDSQGNVYVTGRGNSNYVTLKYSSSGAVLWQAVYNGPANDGDDAHAICVDAAGNVYVSGYSFGNGTETDYATIKYDPNGNELWVQRYNGTNNDNDQAIAVVVDALGNVYAGGWSSSNAGNTDYTIVKYSASGQQTWVRHYNSTNNGNDFMTAMVMDAAGNIYATGKSIGAGSNDYATVKYSPTGSLLWSARYQGSGEDAASSLAVDQIGNVYVTGYSTGITGKDYATVKYNNAGVQQWLKKYNRSGSSVDEAVGLVVDSTGRVFVTGFCSASGSPSYDFVTIGYSTGGTELWIKTYTSNILGVDDKAAAIDIDKYGSIYVTGTSVNSGSDPDYATIKYSSAGVEQWVMLYESSLSGTDNAKKIKVDDNGNVYVTGSATGGITGFDYLTVKYSQPAIGITTVSTEIPKDFELGQNYPNPFNPTTNIGMRIADFGMVSLKVFDITGKEVAVLVDEELNAGVYNIDFDASQLGSGAYFYRMVVGDNTNSGRGFTETKRMILIR